MSKNNKENSQILESISLIVILSNVLVLLYNIMLSPWCHCNYIHL